MKYITDNQSVLENGYFLDTAKISSIVDPYAQIPTHLDFTLITYNSGGQKGLKVGDTINAIELSKELSKLLKISLEQSMIVLHLYSQKAVRLQDLKDMKNDKVIIVDRDEIVYNSLKK
jgi:hypothetical protein